MSDKNNPKISEFMQLYKPVQHRLSAYCRVVTGSEEKARDLIQDTLTAAFENFSKIRDTESFPYYIFSIARNCHLNQTRRLKFFGNKSNIKPANIQINPDSIEKQFDFDLIHKSIARLNPAQRETILLFYLMGLPLSEIAQKMNITEAAVKNRLVRGREKLRKLLSDKESLLNNNISAHNNKKFTK
jgi:RNA polymerase sigma-70 factor (ECF subfamily)